MRILKAILYCIPVIAVTVLGTWFFIRDDMFLAILRWELLLTMTLIMTILLLLMVLFIFNLLKAGIRILLGRRSMTKDERNAA